MRDGTIAGNAGQRLIGGSIDPVGPLNVFNEKIASADAINRAIATKLVIGDETVKTHLSSIYRKLGVSDRTGAVATALREGIYQ